MLDCQSLIGIFGWRCRASPDGSVYISSPVILPDGTPVGFFLSREEDSYVFDDEGLTIFSLRNQGVDLSDRKNWRGLRGLAGDLGFQLRDNGSITKTFPVNRSAENFSLITRLVSSIANWHQERIDQDDEQFTLTDEVERLLRNKGGDKELVINPSIRFKGASYPFHFRWGNTYVDAMKPRARSTGEKVRKSLILRPLEMSDDINFLVIVDNRDDPKRAKEEAEVLGQVVKTMNYTALEDMKTLH